MKLTWSTEKEKSKFPFTFLPPFSQQPNGKTNKSNGEKKRALTREKKTELKQPIVRERTNEKEVIKNKEHGS